MIRNLLLVLSVLLAAQNLRAQTTGLDFTATDCDGTPHHLFAELDAGNVVVMDLVMMACSGCIVATQALSAQVVPTTNDPSRVRFYSIGYEDPITCDQILAWRADHGWDHPVFAGMAEQAAYYGGMGMPTIIVLGPDHAVYYLHLGFSAAEKPIILEAINTALEAQVGIAENGARPEVLVVSPDPVVDGLTLTGEETAYRILDLRGRGVLQEQIASGSRWLPLVDLAPGAYVLVTTDGEGVRRSGRFIKQ
jgi:hypothetical protein